jgi:CRP-like cAMP-binding protein
MVKGVDTTKATIEMLREVKLFQCFSDQELGELLRLGEARGCEAFQNIVIEGELSWGVYLILDGVVGISKNAKMGGNAYDLGQLHRGSFFGEMSLVDENPRSASVRAETDCHLFYIGKDVFSQFLARSPERKVRFYETCVKHMVHRLRDLNDNYVVSQYQLWKTAIEKDKDAA